MPFVQILIHAVWGTKNRYPFLSKEILPIVITHIRENAKKKGIYIDRLNGAEEHLHCLFHLNTDMPLSKAMQLVKGESAHWINKEKLTRSRFEWADEYFAASVSESAKSRVRKYIENQAEHHKMESFEDEYERFIKSYGFNSQG